MPEFLKSEKNTHFILGQLITHKYIDTLVEELNEKLAQDGLLNLSEASKNYDLPGDFLNDQISKRLGRSLFGKRDEEDPNVIYTETYVRRNTAKVRGMLSGVSKPVSMGTLKNRFPHVADNVFFGSFNFFNLSFSPWISYDIIYCYCPGMVKSLLDQRRIDGVLSGKSRTAYYIPNCYIRAQTDWVDGFMRGNGYVDLDAAARLGISDPKSFLIKRFSSSDQNPLVFLSSLCLGQNLFKQVYNAKTNSID